MPAAVSGPEAIYQQSVTTAAQQLASDSDRGLTTEEARQRLEQYGRNELVLQPLEPAWKIFLRQLLNWMVYILGAAAILAFSYGEQLEGIAILVVIGINTLIGFWMERQAQHSMEALREMTHLHARVIRGKQLTEVDAGEIVPGDLLFLEAGDIVAADARLVRQQDLKLQEAALTGESMPVSKQTAAHPETQPVADRNNLVFRGTVVTHGNGHALVFATGTQTELGKIATLTEAATPERSPLEQKLNKLTQKLIWLTLLLTAITFFVGLAYGTPLYDLIKTSTALAVAAIPEGLPIIATITLARGMLRLARHRVIVKRLNAVETLGETQYILTDKTGTLTYNQLSVNSVVLAEQTWQADAEQAMPTTWAQSAAFDWLRKVSMLCNNAAINRNADGEDQRIGDPLEVALLEFVLQHDPSARQWVTQYQREAEQPFDSDTKIMATLQRGPDGQSFIAVKGAPENVLKHCQHTLSADGSTQPLDRERWATEEQNLAQKGLKPLGFAYASPAASLEEGIQNLTFIGCIGFWDAPRQEIADTLVQCHRAGIQVVMVTGDHPETARSVALATGLVKDSAATVVTGGDFATDGLPTTEIPLIYARVAPQQKLALVDHLQSQDYVIGMTGDGVNDAPALKKADIGIAMGQRGTEAAKEAADLVLEDDSFPAIIQAIRQGRSIIRNIRYFVIYLLSCNLSELAVVITAFFAGFGTLLFPLQILFLNMVTDVFPALALGFNKEDAQIMHEPPRNRREPIITRKAWGAIVYYALAMTAAVLGLAYYSRHQLQLDALATNNLVFLALVLTQLWNVFSLPAAGTPLFDNEIVRNRYVWFATLLCLLLTWLAFSIPGLGAILHLQPLDLEAILTALAFSLLPILVIRLSKIRLRARPADSNDAA
jgi:P-type Ca2+ transporter type 2C